MCQHLLLGQRQPGLDHNHCHHRLYPFGVRHTDHRHFGHSAQAVNHFFHLAAGHVFATGLDHVFFAVHHGDEALIVHRGQVARMKPAALKSRFCFFFVAKVTQHQVRGAVHDLADLARRHIVHGVVHHACFDIEHRTAAGARLAQLVVGAQHGGEWRNLGLTIEVPKTHIGQPPRQLAQDLHRHDGRAVITLAQGGQIGAVKQRRAQQRNPHRGRRKKRCDAMLRHQRQQIVWRGFGGDDAGGTHINRRAKKHVKLRAVVQRQRVQHHVAMRNAGIDRATGVLRDHRVVCQHRAFGHGLGAAGVNNLCQVRAAQRHLGRCALACGQVV